MITMLVRVKGKDPVKTRNLMDKFLRDGKYSEIKEVSLRKSLIRYCPRKNFDDEHTTNKRHKRDELMRQKRPSSVPF